MFKNQALKLKGEVRIVRENSSLLFLLCRGPFLILNLTATHS